MTNQHDFQIGDVVLCIDDTEQITRIQGEELVEGRQYTVTAIRHDELVVNGYRCSWMKSRFVPLLSGVFSTKDSLVCMCPTTHELSVFDTGLPPLYEDIKKEPDRKYREWWSNLYENGVNVYLHDSKKKADDWASSKRIECVHVVEESLIRDIRDFADEGFSTGKILESLNEIIRLCNSFLGD